MFDLQVRVACDDQKVHVAVVAARGAVRVVVVACTADADVGEDESGHSQLGQVAAPQARARNRRSLAWIIG